MTPNQTVTKPHRTALPLAIDLFLQNLEHAALTVDRRNRSPPKGPAIAGDPHHAAGYRPDAAATGVACRSRWAVRSDAQCDTTVKTAGLHEIHAGGRHPVTFVIELVSSLRADAHAVGRAMAGGDDLQFTVFIHTNGQP